MQHLLTLHDWTATQIEALLDLADTVKARPDDYADRLHRKTLFMIFEKPSLRTRVSFEVGMYQLGGHAIYYDLIGSPMTAGKESVQDTVRTVSRYGDLIVARLYEHEKIEEMARHAAVPVINGLTDFAHPCQILADLQTIREQKGALQGVRVAYLGDSNNNVTHSLMVGCALLGLHLRIGCPAGDAYTPQAGVLKGAAALGAETGADIAVVHDAAEAARDADVVYTDSWMSYHIPGEALEERKRDLMPFQVNTPVMAQAKPDAIFMNCLPAMRGFEQTADIIDGSQSVVFDQAENRLHAQKAVMLTLLGAA